MAAKKTTTDKTAEKAQAQADAQAAVDALPEPYRSMPYRELATKGKAESDELRKAKKAKKKAPATPHLDALNVRHAAGETYAGTAEQGTSTRAKKEKAPAPKQTGFKPVELRSDKHADLVAIALDGLDTYTEGLWLMVKRDEAQTVADRLAAKGAEVAKVIYDARLYAATYTMVRLAFPTVTGSRRGSGDKLIDALNKAKASWSVSIKLDGTLTYKVVDEAGEIIVQGGARQVAAEGQAWGQVADAA